MFCQLSEISIKKCSQINYVMLECNSNYPNFKESNKNSIQEIDETVQYLKIEGNLDMSFIKSSIFISVFKVINNMNYFDTLKLVFLPNLYYLIIRNSNLNENNTFFQQNFKLLQHLDISQNPINSLNIIQKQENFSLQFLNISFSRIKFLENIISKNLRNLKIFILTNCFLSKIDENFFENLKNLQILQMNNTIIEEEIGFLNFQNSLKIKLVHSEYFKICCLLWKYIEDTKNSQCSPKFSIFQTCSNLINSNLKRIVYFLISLYGLIGSLLFLIFKLIRFQSSNLFLIMICLSDFFISLYILAIALADITFGKNFINIEMEWRKSVLCQILGTLVLFSILLASSSRLFLSIERYQAIVNLMKTNFVFKYRKQYSMAVSCFALSLAFTSFAFTNVRKINFKKVKFFFMIIFFFFFKRDHL